MQSQDKFELLVQNGAEHPQINLFQTDLSGYRILSLGPASCYGNSYKVFLLQTINTPSQEGLDPPLAQSAEFIE